MNKPSHNHLEQWIDGQQVTVSIDMTDPSAAKSLLGLNTQNRRIRPLHVASIASDYATGNYTFTGSPVVVSNDGVLLDGQHRLLAIIKADVTIPLLIVRGVKAQSQINIDTGQRRKFGDVLTLRGYSDGKNLASLVAHAYRWEKGEKNPAGSVRPTNAELLTFLERHPELATCLYPTQAASRKWRIRRTQAALAYWLFDRIDHDENVEFWKRMVTLHDDSSDPIGALQARFLKEMASPATHSRMTYETEMALIIKAWNAYIRGERIVQLRFRAGGHAPEAFPKPLGPTD